MAFLDKVAQIVLEKYPEQMHSLCLVTPNRRAGLFLKKYFAQRITHATWAPDVMSMEDFIARISGVSIQEPVALLLQFYETYVGIEKEQAEPLEEFLKWAPMLMKDFNEIDAHVEQPEQLFANVSDIKKLEAWNPDGQVPTEFQQKYLKFFDKIRKYHTSFRNDLKAGKTAYQGLAYRWAADAVKNDTAQIPWQKILFTGFNALNQAEETIIRTLTKKGLASVLWDADKYYLENKNHEAGFFLRKYRDAWDLPMADVEDNFSIKPKQISIYGVAKNVNQAKLAGNLLATMPAESFRENQTAVVLASEELLLPMINSIPANVERLNITMGYPLRKTPLYGLFDAVFQMHLTTLRMRSAGEGMKSAFYHKDLVRFFRHPATALLWEGGEKPIDALLAGLNKSNRAFHSFQSLASMTREAEPFTHIFSFLFQGFAKQPTAILQAFTLLSDKLDAAFRRQAELHDVAPEQSPWFTDFEALYPVGMIIRKLQGFMQRQEQLQELKTLFMLFQSMARESKLALVGEPLNGLQVMGMLETRNLDFKNLIILSANEDILPASKGVNSFIPYDVKAGFGMPVHKEKDAVFAYHFYRLLQRAENIFLIYNTQTQDLGSSEKSRFITQLQMELPAWNPNIKISERIIALPPAKDNMDHEIRIPKTEEVFRKLWHISESKGFSPSSLSHYIRCSLYFYFRHIAQIRESEQLQETIEANTLGTVVHEVLQNLYEEQQLEGKVVLPDHIEKMFARVEPLTKKSFEDNYEGGDLETGKNLLLSKVALRFVRNFLRHEKAFLETLMGRNQYLTFIKAEENLHGSLEVSLGGKPASIQFNGFADRIDQVEGATRIIDYKTGKVDTKELKLSDWEAVVEDSGMNKSFQLMMYAFLYGQQNSGPIIPGILSLRNISSGLLGLKHPMGAETIDGEAIKAFREQLRHLMQQVFDPSQPFIRTPKEDNCVNCEFRIVCNR